MHPKLKLVINEYDKETAFLSDESPKLIQTIEEIIEGGIIWNDWNNYYSLYYAFRYVRDKYHLPYFGVTVRDV